MGFILFGLFVVAEAVLLMITLRKQREKRQWLRNRVIVGIGEMLLYLFALLLPWAAWDIRFKMCFFILLIRVAIAAFFYAIKEKKVAGRKSGFGAAVSVVGSILVLGLSLLPSFLFTGYEGLETTGEYEVKMVSAVLIDQDRTETFEVDGSKREVPIYIYYPVIENAGESSFPLVIFSHGAFGYYQSNTSTYMELASNGYVVISLDHPYHSFFTEDTDGKIITVDPSFMQEVMQVNEENVSKEEAVEVCSKWLAIRTADINFVLDSMEMVKAQGSIPDAWFVESGETREEIVKVISMTDVDTVGLMGHSLGGAASVSIGRTRKGIDAVIDLDGTMLGEYLKCDEAYPVPLLAIDNEEHYKEGTRKDILYINTAVLENAIDSKHTYFVGSAHMNFTDLPLFSPVLASLLGTGTIDETECVEKMNQIVLEYYDYYLKGQGEVIIKESY